MTARTTRKKKQSRKQARWSADVMRRSDALDLESGIFKSRDPARIARSLKQSAERSKRRRGTPYQSAMSMLTFYINRGGKSLSESRRRVLERAKIKLREVFHRT